MKKLLSLALMLVLCLSTVNLAFAAPNHEGKFSQEKLLETTKLLKKYASQLEVSEEEPYKEVQLPDGTVLFNQLKVNKGIGNSLNKTLNNSLTSSLASNQETYSITSSQGRKNGFGWVLYKLDYTTTWTFDYSTVISSSSSVSVDNGLGWSYKGSDSSGPVKMNNGREHEWTGTAQFAIVVGGIDISNETLINQHRVRYDGTYAWKYDHS